MVSSCLPCRNNGVLSVFWYVTGKRDIADFYVVIRHISTGEIIYETTVAYNKRGVDVRQDKLLSGGGMSNMQLCIIAKRSNHELGLFLESQCVRLSDALREGNRNFYSTSSSSSSASHNSSAPRVSLSTTTKELIAVNLAAVLWMFFSSRIQF